MQKDRRPTVAGRLIAAYAATTVSLLAVLALIMAVLPLSVVHSRTSRTIVLVLSGLAGAAILGFPIAFVARRLAAPIRRMTQLSELMAAGDLGQRVSAEKTAELADLAESLNRTAEQLSAMLGESATERKTRDLILSSMTEGVALVGKSGRIQYLNPAAELMLGIPGHDAGPPSAVIQKVVEQARSQGTPSEVRFEMGHPPRVLLALALPADREGRVLLALRDVTEATRVEAIRKDFAAAASHELKTPVASIRATAETLCETLDKDPPASRRFAQQLLKESERLSRLVADLLDLSRLESEPASLGPVRLDQVAEEEANRLKEAAERAGVALEVKADRPVTVNGSTKDLALAVRNLLDNALEYTHPGGKVTVGVAAFNAEAVLTVTDTGVGIPAKDLPRVFERFYRVDRARSRETGGTGLGLALVKHVAEEHGGQVEAESELGKGSTFRFRVPDPTRTGTIIG